MSITLTTQNFTQFEKEFFITEATFGMSTIEQGLMYVADNVENDKFTFPKMQAAIKIGARALKPTSSGSITLSNKDVNLGTIEVYTEFDPNIFENHWHADQLSTDMLSRGLPATFQSYLTAFYTKKIFEQIEIGLHLGSTGYTTSAGSGQPNENFKQFDGIIRQAITGGALSVASPSAITSANIIAKMEAAKNKMPKKVLSMKNRRERLAYIMSVEDAQKFEEALTSTSFKNNDTTEAGIMKYKGYRVLVVGGLPENTFYFCETASDINSNLLLCITSLSNFGFELNRLQNNSVAMFYKMTGKLGTGIARPDEFVIHTTLTAADFTA